MDQTITQETDEFVAAAPAKATKNTHSDDFLRTARRVGTAINGLSYIAPSLAGRLAFRLFCTPRRQAIKGRDQEFLATSTQYSFEAEDLQIQSYTWHPALPDPVGRVLFVHGWESNSARWRKYVKLFCEAGWEVTAFDAPAHGRSGGRMIQLPMYSRVIKAHMEQFGTPDAIVGHSLGAGAIVIGMTMYQAPIVQNIVLLGCFGSTERVMRDFGRLLGLRPQVIKAIDDVVYAKSGHRMATYSIVEKSAMLPDSVRGLVLHDSHDEVAPVSEAQAIAQNWGVPFSITEGYGHRMQHKSVVRRTFEFLAGC
jgi:pimeloyl-ACP methyl ester carboxylesterase